MKRALAPFAFFVAAASSCVGYKAGRTKLADGSYQLACRKPLADCLMELTDVCNDHGYEIVRGKQVIRRNGVEPVDSEIIESDAIVRCRRPDTLFGAGPPPSASARPSAAPAQRCFPGATQACWGPGACRGAQTCSADGARFGPCDCGQREPPPAVSPDAGAGPPATWAVPSSDAGAP